MSELLITACSTCGTELPEHKDDCEAKLTAEDLKFKPLFDYTVKKEEEFVDVYVNGLQKVISSYCGLRVKITDGPDRPVLWTSRPNTTVYVKNLLDFEGFITTDANGGYPWIHAIGPLYVRRGRFKKVMKKGHVLKGFVFDLDMGGYVMMVNGKVRKQYKSLADVREELDRTGAKNYVLYSEQELFLEYFVRRFGQLAVVETTTEEAEILNQTQ